VQTTMGSASASALKAIERVIICIVVCIKMLNAGNFLPAFLYS